MKHWDIFRKFNLFSLEVKDDMDLLNASINEKLNER